jgi:hypothetical protein
MYQITDYTKQKARELGVDVVNSKNPKKKIDVLKDGKKIASVGSVGYRDYPTFIKLKGKDFADQRRSLYRKRHSKDINVVGSNGWYANKLLW